MQVLTLLAVVANTYSISRFSAKRGIDNTGIGTYGNLNSYSESGIGDALSGLKASGQSYNFLINSPPIETFFDNSGQYLKDYDVGNQNLFSQLTQPELSYQAGEQNLPSYANQKYSNPGDISFLNSYRGVSASDNGYKANLVGLGAYGSSSGLNNIKFSPQPVLSSAPLSTRLTSSPIAVSYPTAVVPVSRYTPAYPPYQQVNPNPIQQAPISLGSGSLGITRLSNGNFALGSGSIGYGGSPPIVGQRPKIQQQIPIF